MDKEIKTKECKWCKVSKCQNEFPKIFPEYRSNDKFKRIVKFYSICISCMKDLE